MGIYDRDYTQEGRGRFQLRFAPRMTGSVVRTFLIINVVVHVVRVLIPGFGDFTDMYCSVFPANLRMALEFWRLVTYQFLHGDFFHILFNMLILFFFGPILEGMWGSRKFLIFYLVCGAMGGLFYTFLVLGGLPAGSLVGASGAIYGMLVAGAIMWPRQTVMLMGIFPMPFAVLAIVMIVISTLGFLGGQNVGGEAAHLAGAAAGAVWVLWKPWLMKLRTKQSEGAWQKRQEQERSFQSEVDRVLDKVQRSGIGSLTSREKALLREATRREQQQSKGP